MGELQMNIFISNANGEPIYQQIVSQIKAGIIAGELKEGEALPSMRLLAKELRISVITTKRAYEELEREGFIVSYTGKGSFVSAPNQEFLKEQKLKETEEYLEKAVAAARAGGLLADELIKMLRLLWEE
jgi:GntR family transcriptional regulator